MITALLLVVANLLHPAVDVVVTSQSQASDSGAPSPRHMSDHESDDKSEDKKKPPCWSFESSVRYVSGFDHLVTIKNDCEKPAFCTVSTDVNPVEQKVTVNAKSSETVLTYRGSPARVFVAKVNCQVEGEGSAK
jgi:hypothetical protein